MWHTFVQGFASVIQILYGFTVTLGIPNYGLAIIIMTILIKVVLFPLTQKQLKSMRAMQEIQPRMKQIQERYKEDQQTLQLKIAELFKEHGVSPLGGCLPLLIQMPIFIAFYQSLYKFEFKVAAHAGFLWIPNIGKPDQLYILAILAALTTYLQQRVSMVDTNDPTQKSMLYMMPLFMAWIAATMPAGLPLYWVVFNTLGILQQLYVNKSSAKAKLAAANGLQLETVVEVASRDISETETSSQQKAAGDKGGKNNGSPDNRKKRKKR